MKDGTEFDFTEEELVSAFRLALPPEEARREALAIVNAFRESAKDWSVSEDLLLLLSLATATGREKVDRLRRLGWDQPYAEGGDDEPLPPEGPARRIRERMAEEEADWERRRQRMRRDLGLRDDPE